MTKNIQIVLPAWLKETDEGVILLIHARPGASRTMITGEYNSRLKIQIQAPPVEGAANKNLKKFLSKKFHIPKKSVEFLSGNRSRQKTLLLQGISISDALSKLQ